MASENEAERDRYREVGQRCACLGLRKASRAVTRFYDRALEPTGLRITQFSILAALRVTGPISINELADVLVMDRTTLSRNVDLLEEQGLTSRRPSSVDARVREVELTERGGRELDGAYPRWVEAQRTVEEALGEEALGKLREALDRAVEATRDAA